MANMKSEEKKISQSTNCYLLAILPHVNLLQ
jgi:hypothetical protein